MQSYTQSMFGRGALKTRLGEQPHTAMLVGTVLVLTAVIAGSRER